MFAFMDCLRSYFFTLEHIELLNNTKVPSTTLLAFLRTFAECLLFSEILCYSLIAIWLLSITGAI